MEMAEGRNVAATNTASDNAEAGFQTSYDAGPAHGKLITIFESKQCPAFAAGLCALGLRHVRKHWGLINKRATEIRPECNRSSCVSGKPSKSG